MIDARATRLREWCLWKHPPKFDRETFEHTVARPDCRTANAISAKAYPGGVPVGGHAVCPICTIADELEAVPPVIDARAQALQRLIDKWRQRAVEWRDDYDNPVGCEWADTANECATELARLLASAVPLEQTMISANPNEKMHASAPDLHKCADCSMDGEACPRCYQVWWQRRHPNVLLASAVPAPPSMADAAEMLWVVLANVSEGNWKQQSEEWQEAAARWRDNYFAALKAEAVPAPPEKVRIRNGIGDRTLPKDWGCLTCGHAHYFESDEAGFDSADDIPWGRCKTCDCKAPNYNVERASPVPEAPHKPAKKQRFPFGMNAEDHKPDCDIRTSRDGWGADCTCGTFAEAPVSREQEK